MIDVYPTYSQMTLLNGLCATSDRMLLIFSRGVIGDQPQGDLEKVVDHSLLVRGNR